VIATAGATPARVGALMLVGHNPALEDAARLLAGAGDARALAAMRRKYPTAAVAELSFEVDRWSDVSRDTGYLARFVRPKDLE